MILTAATRCAESGTHQRPHLGTPKAAAQEVPTEESPHRSSRLPPAQRTAIPRQGCIVAASEWYRTTGPRDGTHGRRGSVLHRYPHPGRCGQLCDACREPGPVGKSPLTLRCRRSPERRNYGVPRIRRREDHRSNAGNQQGCCARPDLLGRADAAIGFLIG